MNLVKILSKLVCFTQRKRKKTYYSECRNYADIDAYSIFTSEKETLADKYQNVLFSANGKSRIASIVDIERLQTTSTASSFQPEVQFANKMSDKSEKLGQVEETVSFCGKTELDDETKSKISHGSALNASLKSLNTDRGDEQSKYYMGVENNKSKSQSSHISYLNTDVKTSRKRPTEVSEKMDFQSLLQAKVPVETIPKYSNIEPYGYYLNIKKKGMHVSRSDTSYANDTKHDQYTTDIESSYVDDYKKDKFFINSRKQDPYFTNSESSLVNSRKQSPNSKLNSLSSVVTSVSIKITQNTRKPARGTKDIGQKELMDGDIDKEGIKHSKKKYKRKSFRGDKDILYLFHKPLQRYKIA